jgi:hypothetical protein
MPWGLDRNEIEPVLRAWHPELRRIRFLPYRVPGRAPVWLAELRARMQSHHSRPSLVQVTL